MQHTFCSLQSFKIQRFNNYRPRRGHTFIDKTKRQTMTPAGSNIKCVEISPSTNEMTIKIFIYLQKIFEYDTNG